MPLICLFGFFFYHFLTLSVIYNWTDVRQHRIYLQNVVKRKGTLRVVPNFVQQIKKESASRVDKSLWKLIMITKEKMLWSFIKWKWAEIGMENYCVRGVFLNFSCWQISWSRKSFRIILKLQLKKRPVTYWISWENSRDFTTPPLVSPRKGRLRKKCNDSIFMTCHYRDLECWHTSFRGKTSETSACEMLAVSSG